MACSLDGLACIHQCVTPTASVHVHVRCCDAFPSPVSVQESLLKVLSVDDDQLITNFRTFFPSSSPTELLRLFKLRSLKSEQQKRLIERYNATVPINQQIQMDTRVWTDMMGKVGDMADLVNPLALVSQIACVCMTRDATCVYVSCSLAHLDVVCACR